MPDQRVEYPLRPDQRDMRRPAFPVEDIPSLEAQVQTLAAAILNLEQAIRSPRIVQHVDNVQAATTNSSGNVVFPVYTVGQGFEFHLQRLLIESDGYTPAAPYSNASFWLGIFTSSDPAGTPGQGQMIDFLPTTAGAQGIPDVADYDPAQILRTGQTLVCRIVTGPTSKRITARYQGTLVGA